MREPVTCFLSLFCCAVHCAKGVFSQKLSHVYACVSNVRVCCCVSRDLIHLVLAVTPRP